MKHFILKTVIAFLPLVFTATIVQAENSYKNQIKANRVVILKTEDNRPLELKEPNSGKLYKYSEGREQSMGYATIYYLFTSREYLQFEIQGLDLRSYITIHNGRGAKISKISDTTSNNRSARIADFNTGKYFIKITDDEAWVNIGTDKNNNKREETILLIILPELQEGEISLRIKHGNDTFDINDFSKETLDSKSESPLKGYSLLISRPNSIVVDSITIANKKIALDKDTPIQEGKWEIPLDTFDISNEDKEIGINILYREFADKKIKPTTKYPKIELNWDNSNNFFTIFLTILGVVLMIVFALFLAFIAWRFIKIRKKTPQTNKLGKKESETPGESTTENNRKPEIVSNLADDEESTETDISTKSYEERIQDLQQKIEELNRQIVEKNEKIKELANSANSNAITNLKSEIERLNDCIIEKDQRIEGLRQSVEDNVTEIKNLKTEKNNLEIKSINAENQTDRITTKFQEEIARLKQKAINDIAEAKSSSNMERDDEWRKLAALTTKLRDILDSVADEAFGGAGSNLKAGINEYCETFEEITNSDTSLVERMRSIRALSLKQLNYPSGCWIHLLGRIYSYMSVETLRNQLEMDGLSLSKVGDAYRIMTVLFAVQGIVVANCSPGFDSNNDPMTHMLFRLDTQVDRITKWLGGREILNEQIPNHGGTIYDFGQLAYYTYEDTTIHQGSVIYYTE